MKTSPILFASLILLVGLVLCAAPKRGRAADKKTKPLDSSFLRDYSLTRGYMLGRPQKATPTPDGSAVLFLRAKPREAKMSLFEFDVASQKTRELLSPAALLKGAEEKLTPEEKARRERMRVSVGGFTTFQLSPDGQLILLSLSGKLYTVRRGGQPDITELKTGNGTLLDPKFSPDGALVSYVLDHDVYVYNLQTNKEERATTHGNEKVSHGLAEFVAQEEMDRYTGYWWSPDSKRIVYAVADANDVEVWHVSDPAKPEQEPFTSFYPRPGKKNVDVRLEITTVGDKNDATIFWDRKKHPYLAQVRWDKLGPLTITVQSRDQQELVLLLVDPRTGKTTPLVTDKDAAWINLDPKLPRWLGEERFLWQNESDEGTQLELRSKSNKKAGVLVPARLGYQELIDVDAEAGNIVFAASTDPTQSQLYRLSLKEGSKPEALTKAPGLHGAVFAKNHSIYVETTVGPSAMPVTTVHQADGTRIGTLPSVAEEPPFVPQTEWVKIGAKEGYYASITRPHDFDPKKKYPVIDYVYGGLRHQKVLQAMNTRLIDQWLADQGFIVVSIDNRG
ncbi:MAG: DPP IV N-terminal domain-containing protein, partial [Gemmataceae bacterium]